MRYVVLFSFVLLTVLLSYGQDTAVRIDSSANQIKQNQQPKFNKSHKVLLVPFEPKMYMSSIDKDLSAKTGMAFADIRTNMRFGLSQMLLEAMHDKTAIVSLLHIDSSLVEQDLNYIYSSIGYNYTIVPEKTERNSTAKTDNSTKEKLKSTWLKVSDKTKKTVQSIGSKRNHEKSNSGSATTAQGQIVTLYDSKERHMHTSIHNPELLVKLSKTYGTDLFIFINELDIEKDYSATQKAISTKTYNRKLKVHYTTFNKNGHVLTTGAATTYFSNKTNDMNIIIKKHFRTIAEYIAGDIFHQTTTSSDPEQSTDKDN